MRMSKFLISGITIVAIVYLAVAVLLYVFQRDLLYFPTPEYKHDLAVLEVVSESERIKVLVLNPGQSRALIYFGGNAEPVIFNQQPFTQWFTDHTVYLVNYRGYGGSSGEPSEAGLFADALAVYDRVQSQHQQFSIVGRSLGSGVASYLASQRKVAKLILVTPYDSILAVAQARFPVFPLSFLMHDKYESIKRVADISASTLILVAENDRVIPPSHALELTNAFPTEQVKAITITDSNHNNLSVTQGYKEAIQQFLQ